MHEEQNVVSVKNLSVVYDTSEGAVYAVNDVSFDLRSGENLGLVGESGCGKTTLARGLLRLLPDNGRVSGGSVDFCGHDLFGISAEKLRRLRWERISWITQSAMNSLNPVFNVGAQITEAITTHTQLGEAEAESRAVDLFSLVDIAGERLREYPHQFSGGMKQRAIIAMAMALDPDLIIADEPTTALDVILQAQILKRLLEIQAEMSNSIIMITHDISVVAQMCHHIAVMYGGYLVEKGPVETIINAPHHPYTLGLRNAFPSIVGEKRRLVAIPGTPPDLAELLDECIFAHRCPFREESCRQRRPDWEQVGDDHYVACHRREDAEMIRSQAGDPEVWAALERTGSRAPGGDDDGK